MQREIVRTASLRVAIQCGKFSLRTHTNPKIATRLEFGPLGLWPGPVRQPTVCARLHRCLRTRASKQALCCNKMAVIKVSQSSLEELIELVWQCPEIYDATHPDHKAAVKGANIWASSSALTRTNFTKSSSSSCCIFSILYHTAAIVLGVWLGKSIQHLYAQSKLIPAHLLQGMEDGQSASASASAPAHKEAQPKRGDCQSSKSDLTFGVPQWSVLGPLLFTLYTTPLSSLISGHAIPHHVYVDDRQLHVSYSSGASAAALNGLQLCLASVHPWMLTNKLKLNSYKTEFLLNGNEGQWSRYLYVSYRAFRCQNLPSETCSKSWSNFWQKLQLLLTYICSLQFMYVPHLGSMAYSLSPWTG